MAGCMRLLLCLILLAGSIGMSDVNAEKPPLPSTTMVDPTRPPDELTIKPEVSPEKDGKPALAKSGLQTIISRKGAKPMAVINGEIVYLGGMVGDARLVRLGEMEVELDGPNGKEVMRMTPSVEKKMILQPNLVSEQKRGRKVKRSSKNINPI